MQQSFPDLYKCLYKDFHVNLFLSMWMKKQEFVNKPLPFSFHSRLNNYIEGEAIFTFTLKFGFYVLRFSNQENLHHRSCLYNGFVFLYRLLLTCINSGGSKHPLVGITGLDRQSWQYYNSLCFCFSLFCHKHPPFFVAMSFKSTQSWFLPRCDSWSLVSCQFTQQD